jgi:fimbrial isopeptide formation D2 family protein
LARKNREIVYFKANIQKNIIKGVEKMKIGKKSYIFGSFVLIIGILTLFLIKNREPIKADNEKYTIVTSPIDATGKIATTLKIAEPKDETFILSYDGIAEISKDDLLAGVSSENAETVEIEETTLPSEKIIKTKAGNTPIEITFHVAPAVDNVEGEIRLYNSSNEKLTSTKVSFSETSSAGSGVATFAQPMQSLTGTYPGDIGEPGPTTQEMEAANQAANAAIGFDPEVNVKHVSTWDELRTAYNDATVTKIILDEDISNASNQTMSNRRTSIEIDGAGHTLYLNARSFEINSPTDGIGFFHIHDLIAQQNLNNGLSSAGRYAVVNGSNFTSSVVGWTFRTGNVTTEPVNGKRVGRFIRAYQSMIQVYGYVNLTTTEENFYAGGVIVEDKTQWRGTVTYANYSAVWFVENSTNAASTSKSMEFTVGKDALVSLKNETTGATYPAVYEHYRAITIGEGSTYNSNMQGNSVRFDDSGASMTVKNNATVNLLSRGNGSVMQFSANNTAFNLEAGGSIYIVGSTTSPIVDLSSGSNRTFTMESPKGFDIRNKNTGSTSNSPAVSTGNSSTNIFTINDSDIDLWTLRSELMGPSQQTYAKVANFSVKAGGGTANVTTSESGLAAFVPTQYRRIAGMNTNPKVEWVPVTDADKSYQARVEIGLTPTDTFDADGNVVLQSVYAGAGQANVTFTDTFGETHTVATNAQGYAVMTDTKFNRTGGKIKAHAVRGPWASEIDPETTVLDITPPEPAEVVGAKVTNATKQLVGANAEANAKIYIDINGVRQSTVGKVNADGTWTYNLPQYLEKGDTVQIFLEDNAAEITEELSPAVPDTNSANGNINPAADLNYRDALFKAATKYTVEDVLPDKPLIEKAVVSSGGATTQVGDTLTYTITAKNNKAADYDTLLANTVIKDTLPVGLNFDPTTAEIKIDGTASKSPDDYSYDSDTRLLNVKVGDLATGDSVVITFKAKVASSAVGTIITNKAELIGESPREKTFVAGPNNPDAEHETYNAISSEAKNPGGTVFGVLELASAPTEIDFGSVKYQGKKTRVNAAEHRGADLVVKDSRANKNGWTLTAKLTTPMTSTDPDIPAYTLVDALKYVYNNHEITLNGGAQDIMSQAANATTTETTYNISDTWSETGDGFKFEASAQDVQALGTYQGEILWELGDTP